MDVIFLDTNSIRNNGANTFFGNIEEFERISQQVQIAIPSMVMLEIKRQKRRYLNSQLDKFKVNYFTSFLEIDTGDILNNHIEERIDELYDNCTEEIPHIEVELDHKDKLLILRDHALKNFPPFDSKSDKGFKDAYIYLTVLDYLEQNKPVDLFIVTNDTRLELAFDHHDVVVLSSIDEYYSYREAYFKEEYFIGRAKEYLNLGQDDTLEIVEVDISDNDDWLIKVEAEGEVHQLVVDFVSREIIDQD